MKKIGVVITDGVGFRNFILSDFIKEAESTFDEVVILSFLPKEIYAPFTIKPKIIELPVLDEKFKTWFFRKAKEVAHLSLNKKGNFGIESNYQKNKSKAHNPRGYATRFIFLLTSVLNSEKWIQRYDSWQQATFKRNVITHTYQKILEQEKTDILFFTHQRPPFIAPLAYQAKKQHIKTCSFIFSWDNLASKGRMATEFDYFLVWSDLMKKELLQFYPSVKKEQIEVVGTPQFEPYVLDRYKSGKADFYKKFGLDSSKKTICYSCGDVSTSKNDELYIATIADAILGNEIKEVNFLVRTSPAESHIRFAETAKKYPFIKWNYPKWHIVEKKNQETWAQRIPTVDDVIDLRSIIEYADLNVNMLSTMSLDFMQFDKPVINPAFGNGKNGLYNDQRFLSYAHLMNVVNSKATIIAKNKEELIKSINTYLKNPELHRENRKQLIAMQVGKPLEQTSKRIAEIVYKWS